MIDFDRNLCGEALHKFFQDERLRCYLKDIVDKSQKRGDERIGYNPVFLYILNLHGCEKIDSDASDFWNNHRIKFKQKNMLDLIATLANRDKGIYDPGCLKTSQIPSMIDAAFEKYLGVSRSDTSLKRHVKLDKRKHLSTFFKSIFVSNDLNALKELSASVVHAVPNPIGTVPENDAPLPVDQPDDLQGDVVDSGIATIEDGSSMNNVDNDDLGYNFGHGTDNEGSVEVEGLFDEDSGYNFGHGTDNEGSVEVEGLFDEDSGYNFGHGTDNEGSVEVEGLFDEDLGYNYDNDLDNDEIFVLETDDNLDLYNGNGVDTFVNGLTEKNDDKSCVSSRTLSASESDVANLKEFEEEGHVIKNNDKCSMLVVEHDHSYTQVKDELELRNFKTRVLEPKGKNKELSHICELCGAGYSGQKNVVKAQLERHFFNKHNMILCGICNEKFVSMTEKVNHVNETHIIRGGNISVYICDHCGTEIIASIKTKAVLREHMEYKHMQHHQCLQCKKLFKNKYILTHHIGEIHTTYICKHDGIVFHGYYRYREHSLRHTCRESSCRQFFKSVSECTLHEEISHFKSVCDVCNIFCPGNVDRYFNHIRTCNREKVESRLNDVRVELINSFNKITAPQHAMDLAQLTRQDNQRALFTESTLYARDVAGNIIHDADFYPFWDKTLICPAFGSHSIKPENNSTNAIRNQNPMLPWWFKPFSFDSYPLGSSCMIMYDAELNMPKWSFQLFILEDWKAYQQDKGDRTNFKANKDVAKIKQQAPKVLDKKMDRGHLVPFQYACSPLDRQELQNQGNIFYQLASQNRGIWKKMESELIKELQQRQIPRSHITTGVNYVKENGEVIYSHGIPIVHSYYKVCFMEDSSGKVNDIVCYALRNDNSTSPKVVPRISLFDIETIVPTHQFLNADLERRMQPGLLKKHSISWIRAVP